MQVLTTSSPKPTQNQQHCDRPSQQGSHNICMLLRPSLPPLLRPEEEMALLWVTVLKKIRSVWERHLQRVLQIYILMQPGSQRLEIIIVWFLVFWFLIKVTIQCESEVRHQCSFLPKETLIDVNKNTGFQLTFALREHTDINNSLFSVHG